MPHGPEQTPRATTPAIRRRAVLRATQRRQPANEQTSPAAPLPPRQPPATAASGYPIAEVTAAVAASCLLTALLFSAAAVVAFSSDPTLARRFGDEQRQALIFVGLTAAVAVSLVTFATAWSAATPYTGNPLRLISSA